MQSILSPRCSRMVIRMSRIFTRRKAAPKRLSFARHGFIFTFHASLRRFIEFQNFVSPTYVDLRRDASSKSGRIRGRWMRSRIWFDFLLSIFEVENILVSMMDVGWILATHSTGFSVFPLHGCKYDFVVGLFEACPRWYFIFNFLHIFAHIRACFTLIYFDVWN